MHLSGMSPQMWLIYECIWENHFLVEDTHWHGGGSVVYQIIGIDLAFCDKFVG